MTEESHAIPNASTIEDARNKLDTVTQILAHLQTQGLHDVSIHLVEALLVPASQALAGAGKNEERSDLGEPNDEEAE